MIGGGGGGDGGGRGREGQETGWGGEARQFGGKVG